MNNLLISMLVLVLSSSAFAKSSHVGMIVKKQGKVELLINPSKKANGAGYVLYEGMFYKQGKVRLGAKLTNGAILRTGKGAKVKVVYKNGDQMNVGEATAYQISWKPGKKKDKNPGAIKLIYGSIRGVISKKGPRSNIKIKTKQAVMGIRGTDFHVGQRGTSGKSALSVLRGKVEVADIKNPQKKISVSQGFSAEIKKEVVNKKVAKGKKRKKKAALFQVVKTTKNDLVEIQKDSEIKQDKKDLKEASSAVKKQLAKLEKKAVENTLSDIKEYDPELYNNLKEKKVDDLDKINKVVVGKVFEKAPVKKVKIGIDDDALEEDAYEKYFSIDEKSPH